MTKPILDHNPTRRRLERAERSRTAKNPDAALRTLLRDKAVALVREKGVARTRDFAELGITRFYLCKLCAEGFLSRAGYGLYAAPKDAA
jgi:hypothetical protein